MADETTGSSSARRRRRSAPPNCRTPTTTCRCAPISLTVSANGFARAMSAGVHPVGGRRQAVRRRAEVAGAADLQHGGDGGVQAARVRLGKRARPIVLRPVRRRRRRRQGLEAAMGAIKPFAAGGVIGDADLFPAVRRRARAGRRGRTGGDHAAGARPRRPARRRGERRAGQRSVTIQIATPDVDSFRRSESYLTGQIARAVARGQRGL